MSGMYFSQNLAQDLAGDNVGQKLPGEQWSSENLSGEKSLGKKWLQRTGLAVAGVMLLVGLGMVMQSLMSGQPAQKKRATTINIMVPDAPPPPPPPKVQPPEQPKEVRLVQPKPQAAPPTPSASLKMEGAAGDGGSPFAAGSVSKDYIGGKVDMSTYAWYTGQISVRIEEALAAQKELAKAQYRLIVHVWLARDGTVERAELQGSSGDRMIDNIIRKALTELGALSEGPPADMPQPVKLRITSKNSF